MKFRNVLIVGILFAALAGYVLFIDRHQKSSEERQAEDLTILAVEGSQVSFLKIENSSSAPIEIGKKNGRWQVLSPEPMQADADTVESLLSELEFLRAERVIVPEANQTLDLAQYGLDATARRIVVKASSAEQVLLIGKKAPMGKALYVSEQGKAKVFVVPESIERMLIKKAEDFRNRVMMEFDTDAVEKIEVANASGTYEARHADEQWSLATPVKDKQLDQEALNGMLWELRKLKMKKYLGTQEKQGSFWDKPAARASVWLKGAQSPMTLVIGNALPSGEYIARIEGGADMFTLESYQGEALKKSLLKSIEATRPEQLSPPPAPAPAGAPAKPA